MDLVKSVNKTVTFYIKFEHKRIIKKFTPKQLGRWTKDQLAMMGPSFIKIGQFVSTRSDIFTKEFTNELKDLQDNVAPISWQDLKKYIPSAFKDINENPLASASIGQVHTAKLQDNDIILKIKRPDIELQIKNDFNGLLMFIKGLKLFSNDRRLTEFEILFTEYYNLLLEEIDFIKEAANIDKFAKMFKNTKWIKIPKVYREFCNNDYITMEYVPCIKINDIEKLNQLNFDTEKIATKLVQCYVDQIIKYGFVHIDPHPGNVGVTLNGQIVFYDYGMVLVLDTKIQKHFDELLVALYDKDVDEIARVAVEIGLVVVDPINIAYFKKFLIFFLSYIEKMNVNDFKVSYIDNISETEMPFLISSKFLLLLRGISILEGNCKALDKNFNYKKTLDPYIENYLIDIRYLENKARLDFDSIKTFPTKIKEQQVELDIMRLNNASNSVNSQIKIRKKAVFIGGTILSMLILQDAPMPMPIYAAVLSIILLV
jgi:predicted unusual protein kinase regulating ubiquinone biosynthesis (AarF/ABC1/UbiB family)